MVGLSTQVRLEAVQPLQRFMAPLQPRASLAKGKSLPIGQNDFITDLESMRYSQTRRIKVFSKDSPYGVAMGKSCSHKKKCADDCSCGRVATVVYRDKAGRWNSPMAIRRIMWLAHPVKAVPAQTTGTSRDKFIAPVAMTAMCVG